MLFLFKFLYRNLKGYRFLIILAMIVTIAQVGSDLLAAMPLKFIPSKVNNPGSDPTCAIVTSIARMIRKRYPLRFL